MSNLLHDVSLSSAIVSGFLLALALGFDVLQRIFVGSADQVTMDVVTALLAAFITAVTAERVARQAKEGRPVLPLNGLTDHNASSGGSDRGNTNQGST